MSGIPSLAIGAFDLASERRYFALIWAHRAGGLVDDRQPDRLAPRSRTAGARQRSADGTGIRHRPGSRQDRRLRLRGAARLHLGLALRPSAAFRESDAFRHQPGDRIPVHGGRRRRGERVGRRRRRDADYGSEADASGRAADAPWPLRQLRDRRLRGIDDRPAAIRSARCLACGHASDSAQKTENSVTAGPLHPSCVAADRRRCRAFGPPCAKGLRRSRRRERPELRHTVGRNFGPDRTQRRGEEHDVRADQRRTGAFGRRHRVSGCVDCHDAFLADRRSRHQPHVPARTPAARHVGARQRRARCAPAGACRRVPCRIAVGSQRRRPHPRHRRARGHPRVGLALRLHDDAGSLSLGEQRIVEIARALAADPSLLLLDEPAAGLRRGKSRRCLRCCVRCATKA